MSKLTKPDPQETLKNAKNILLVDWPDPGVPRALLNAGFRVFGFSPGAYSEAKLVTDLPEGQKGFPPRHKDESGYLIFKKLDERPDSIDVVNVYRPEEEHAGIIENHVLPLNAKVLWLHPPVTSAHTAAIASQNGLIFIEDADISQIASKI